MGCGPGSIINLNLVAQNQNTGLVVINAVQQ
jgi:hypothetical protein